MVAEIKDLSHHSIFLKIPPIRVQTFMTSIGRVGEEVLKFVTCLHILLFLNSRSTVHFLQMGVRGWGRLWVVDVIIV